METNPLMQMRMLVSVFLVILLSVNHSQSGQGHVFFDRVQARIASIRQVSGDQRREACLKFVQQAFDTSEIGKRAASEHWQALARGLRTELVSAIAARLGKECVGVVSRLDPADASIARIRETADGIRMTVVFTEADGRQSFVVWSLRPGGVFAWTALDLSVDGRGMLATFKSDFESALIATGGNLERAIEHFARMVLK